MTKDDLIKKNLDLHAEWMKYAFEEFLTSSTNIRRRRSRDSA